MTSIQPIQIIGTQRSGSNLLRLMLNQHPQISAPHPPHILQRFMPLLPLYGPLEEPGNFKFLVDDICTLVECNPVPWIGLKFNRGEIVNLCQSRTLIEIFRVIYDLKARHENASFWVCKSMSNVVYAREMETAGMKPLYIHLYRDGRDVACSFKNAIVGEKHVYAIANQWRDDQQACIRLQQTLDANRFLPIRYESLIGEPEKAMRKVCNFLKIDFSAGFLDYYTSEESKKTANAGKMWANVSRPILKNNTNIYKTDLSKMEIAIFEKQAGKMLDKLGYNLETSGILNEQPFSLQQISEFEAANKLLKEKAGRAADLGDIKLREPQQQLLKQIINRKNINL